ncbi:MAG: hypothetical protein U1E06_25335 [Tabrizicola sp.]|uniref:hypothetical protein n=1 Tax=Tabrizicola sp. TaxID=2005166 RepID=UPI002737182E|nr:hypothetical protein [Tabrizicola sp.]MDP3264554.1 hypothetical protein [Tabrizicola sp.]MDZ4070126.1 hypothetical protein [Tabrizicola sp.]
MSMRRGFQCLERHCREFTRILGCAGVSLALTSGTALACALPPSVILTLPTGHYITGAALAVGLTAILGALSHRLPSLTPVTLLERRVLVPVAVSSYMGFLGFLGLILIGLFGSRDPMHNLMTLVFWTGVWIAVPLGSMLMGNLWRPINPWTGPVRIARTLLGRSGSIGLARFGHLPAILGYAGFVWFQMVSLSPDDPAVLALTALAYWAVVFTLAVLEGDDWLEQGEFLTVLFGMIAKVAPFWLRLDGPRAKLMAGWPGAQVLTLPPLGPSAIIFVTLALAALTFDGLAETFWWQALIGENPLEPTGRSGVMLANTVGLMAVWVLTLTLILGVVALGRRLGGAGLATGPVMLSFLAIAAGYHAAHYLVVLLTAGQYTLAALNDPFFVGDAWLGLPPFYVSFGFLTDPSVMPLIYAAQFAAILGAHLLAVVLALKLAGQGARPLAHLPLTVLMVGYTVLGLWLLSTARTG